MICSKLFRSARSKNVTGTAKNISYFFRNSKLDQFSAGKPILVPSNGTKRIGMSQISALSSSTLSNGQQNASSAEENIVWVDTEMTGLEPEKDQILEIACLVTDGQLNVIAEGPNLVIHQSQEVLDNMNEWSLKQHALSGLTQRCKDSKVTLQESERQLLEFVRTWAPFNKCPLGGNTIYMDRLFLKIHMPEFEKHMHYRTVDVSSVKELCRRWYPEIYNLQPNKKEVSKHRALDDILCSIKELKFYREKVFKKPEVGEAMGMSWC